MGRHHEDRGILLHALPDGRILPLAYKGRGEPPSMQVWGSGGDWAQIVTPAWPDWARPHWDTVLEVLTGNRLDDGRMVVDLVAPTGGLAWAVDQERQQDGSWGPWRPVLLRWSVDPPQHEIVPPGRGRAFMALADGERLPDGLVPALRLLDALQADPGDDEVTDG